MYLDIQLRRLQGREVGHVGAPSRTLYQVTQQSSENRTTRVPQVPLQVGGWRGLCHQFSSMTIRFIYQPLFTDQKKEIVRLNSQQTILILNKIQYLKHFYLFMIQKDTSNHSVKFSDCCRNLIEHMRKTDGINVIKYHELIMNLSWNETMLVVWMSIFLIQIYISKMVVLTSWSFLRRFLR